MPPLKKATVSTDKLKCVLVGRGDAKVTQTIDRVLPEQISTAIFLTEYCDRPSQMPCGSLQKWS